MTSTRHFRLGFAGGGGRSLIGDVHRGAALLSGRFDLVAGAFGTSQQRNRDHALALGISPDRAYPDLETMLKLECSLPEHNRIEVIAILTPNHLHYPMVHHALTCGLHVMCEKPFTVTAAQALELQHEAADARRLVAIAHTYTGYPMVRQMRAMIAAGEIGSLQKIDVQYYQGWINPAMQDRALRSGIWRLDGRQAGLSCCQGDIGVHAFNLVEYVTGLEVARVLADLNHFDVKNPLDVDGTTLFRTRCGVPGVVRASQIATGEENNLQLAVYGSEGALKWSHERPAELLHLRDGAMPQLFSPGHTYNAELSRSASQLPPGHPQGLVEAMANLYRGFADALDGVAGACERFTGIDAGVRGMLYIEAALRSAARGQTWEELCV